MSLPKANKDLGQHFLRDQNIIKKITEDFKDRAEAIVEVGPGPGILTEHLARHQLPFQVIEKDERFPEYLRKYIGDEQITLQDGLTIDFGQWIAEKNLPGEKIWMVSNLPYNVGTPLFVNFLQVPQIEFMTLMFQKEVADKVIAFTTRKGKEMGSLMALAQNYFDVKLLCKVPPGAFSPPPKVDSAVISLVRKKVPAIPLERFSEYEKFLREMFQFKRKQIGKIMKAHTPVEKLMPAFEKAGIKPTDRAETFNLEQIQLLFKELRG